MGYLETVYARQRHGDLPEAERRAAEMEALGQMVKNAVGEVGHQEIEAAKEVSAWSREAAPLLKAEILAPTVYQHAYPAAYQRRRPSHQSVLYVSELGPGAGLHRYADKQARFAGLSFLKAMAKELDIIGAIKFLRASQSSAYWRPYREDDANPLGYRWIRKDGERMTPDDRREVKALDDILQNCGTETDPIQRQFRERRRSLPGFMKALTADTLTADWCPFETERAQNGKLIGWHNIPMDTVRLTYEEGYNGNDQLVAVQLGMVTDEEMIAFEADEIVCPIRNPRSDAFLNGYGESELENLIRAMTAYLNAITFNAAALDRNTIPRGFLTVYGDYDKRQVNAFTGQWNALLRGAARRFAMPVLFAKSKNEGGAAWTPVDTAQTEMLATRFLTFLISMACAEFQVAPEELNMDSFSTKNSGLSGEDTSEKLQSGRDKGLIPHVIWQFDDVANPYIVGQLTPKYCVVPVGLFPEDEARKHERQKLANTIDELRSIDGEEPHPNPLLGNAPNNPSLLQLYMQDHMQQEQARMGGVGADGGPDFGLPQSERPPQYGGPQADEPAPGDDEAPEARTFAKADVPRFVASVRDVPPETWDG